MAEFYNRQQQDVINEQQATLNRWQPIVAQSEKYNAEILNVLMAGPIAPSSNLIYAVQNINLGIDQLEQQRSQARSEVITR